MVTVYETNVEGIRLPPSLPQICHLDFSIKKRRVLGLPDGPQSMLFQWAQIHALPVQELSSHAQLPPVLLSSPVHRHLWIKNALEVSGLNPKFWPEIGRTIEILALKLSDHAGYGFHISINGDVWVAEGVPGGGGGATNAHSHSVARAAIRQIIKDRMEKNYGVSNGACCSICLDEFATTSKMMKTPCSHCFHSNCILSWLDRHNSCPLCRSPF